MDNIDFDFAKYSKPTAKYNLGDIIQSLVHNVIDHFAFQKILFVRTSSTGGWLDDLFVDNPNVTRIMYYTDDTIPITTTSTTAHYDIMHSDEFVARMQTLVATNTQFDFIGVDTWHEYDICSRDFTLLASLLTNTGMLISHDCFPWTKQVANPTFIPGSWCGETYVAFVKLAYDNPDMFYGIINIDTGIGIASKQRLAQLSNGLSRHMQTRLFDLHATANTKCYPYFRQNAKHVIHCIE